MRVLPSYRVGILLGIEHGAVGPTRQGSVKLNIWDYDRWQEELDRVLLRERTSTEPVVLFVSREMLQENFPFFDNALNSLAQSVVNLMRTSSSGNAFGPMKNRLVTWQRGSRITTPPVLPLIAVTVAAAAEMGSDERGGPLMFYGRLQEILGHQVSAAQLSNSYDEVASIWRILNEWIMDQSWLGTSTIVEDRHLSRIGFARSQALMSKQDALNLSDFFYAIGRIRLNDLTPSQQLSELTRWNRKYKRLSRSMTRSLDGDPTGPARTALMSVVSLLSNKWDGHAKERSGQTMLRVQIRLDLTSWSARWVIPRQRGIEAFSAVDTSGRELTLHSNVVGSFYSSTGLPESVSDSIDYSRSWVGENGRVQMKPRKVWIFTTDSVSGDWVSTKSVNPFDEMVLLVREDQSETLSDILDSAGVASHKRVGGSRQIISGWDLFLRVVLPDKTDDTRLAEWLGYGHASMDEAAELPRLVNGLKIRTRSGVDVYIAGGEPDLVVPATPFGTYSVSLDDSAEAEFRANGSALPLHKLVSPEPARHVLMVNESHILEFETISVEDENLTISPVEGAGQDKDLELRNLSSSDARKVFSRSATNLFISKNGNIHEIMPPPTPEWLEKAGYFNGSRFDIVIPDDAIWLAIIRRDKVRSIEKINDFDMQMKFESLEASAENWKILFRDESLMSRTTEWLNTIYQARRLMRI